MISNNIKTDGRLPYIHRLISFHLTKFSFEFANLK